MGSHLLGRLDITVALGSLLLLPKWNLVVVEACILAFKLVGQSPLRPPLWLSEILLQLLLSGYHIRLVCLTLRHNLVEYPIFVKASIFILDCRPQNFVLVAVLYVRLSFEDIVGAMDHRGDLRGTFL